MERLTNEQDLKIIEEFKQQQNTITADANYFVKLYKKLYWLENNIDISKEEEKTIKDKLNERKAYVIRRNDGKYWLGGFYGKDNVGTITQAKIYQNKTNADGTAEKIQKAYNIKVKVVPIEIKEIEE